MWRLGAGEGADNVGGQLHSLISTEPFGGRWYNVGWGLGRALTMSVDSYTV